MFPYDGTRSLLPPIIADPDDIIGPEMPLAGLVLPVDMPSLAVPAAQGSASFSLRTEAVHSGEAGFSGTPSGIATKASEFSGQTSDRGPAQIEVDVRSPEISPHPLHKPAAFGGGTDAAPHVHEAGSTPAVEGAAPVAGGSPAGAPSPLPEDDASGDSVSVTQLAVVDQDASIFVSGYVGEVVARLHIDQDIDMDQYAKVDVVIDGDGNFYLLVDQDTRIDQDVEIDLKLSDEGGVLYVDLYVKDIIDVEQDTIVDMRVQDGPAGGTIDVDQDVELTQNVDVDIDIESDLEERYIVQVQVETLQLADVDQDVVVDARNTNGEVEMDVDSMQTAFVEQQTIVHADFTLV